MASDHKTLAGNPVEEVMVKSSKVDPSSKNSNTKLSGFKDGALSDATSCISSVDAVCSTKEVHSHQDDLLPEQAACYPMNGYYGYFYPGYDVQFADWDGQGYFWGADRLDVQQTGVQPDAGSYVYCVPGFQPGYDPYSSFVPGAVVGIDGQYLGQQPYSPGQIVSQPFGSPVYFPPYGWDLSAWNGGNNNSFVGDLAAPAPKPKFWTKTKSSKSTFIPKSATGETKSCPPVLQIPTRAVANQFQKHVKKSSLPRKDYFPMAKLPSYTYNNAKNGLLYPTSPINVKENGQSLVSNEKIKAQKEPIGFGDVELLTEQNRGPRTNSEGIYVPGDNNVEILASKLEDLYASKTNVIKKDDYNLPDFQTKYEEAMFFVIKSYSEDDIHKSIKYNVWASTPNGNRRLDDAFQAAQDKSVEKGCKIPIFLFFSVNASGQFCGVAEMTGWVNFTKNMEFWQQDKWSGFFPVKWHMIKDVSNPQFRHIILENNDNKPVTNSRDTQEVKFAQGSEMLSIFKSFSSKTSILDDFGFYENRQKVMQEKRCKVPAAPVNIQVKTDESRQTKNGDLKTIISGMDAVELSPTLLNKNEPLVAAAQ